MADQGSKTEPATPRQRQKAREKGQVARSVELVSAVMLFCMFLLLFQLTDRNAALFTALFRDTAGSAWQYEVTPEYFPTLIADMVLALFRILTPFLLASVIIVLFLNFMQVGIVFSAQPLNPDINRLNPIKGFQKIFSMKALVDFIKNMLKLLIVGVVGFSILHTAAPVLRTAISMAPLTAIDYALSVGFRIGIVSTMLLLVLGILDYVYQRFEHEKSIKMSKQEIKDEYKNSEGDPQIKRRIRDMGRQFIMSRMMESLQQADAVITNPTHYAVAVQYELEWPAPKVVAKGKDYAAKRLIRAAEELGLPVYEQPQLARALYQVDADDFVPAALFKTVAKVLAHLSRFDQRLRLKLRGVKM